MNCVFLSPVGVIGGAERVLIHLLDAVDKLFPGAQRTLIQLGDGPLADEAARRGVSVVVEPATQSLASVGDTQWRDARSPSHAAVAAGVALSKSIPGVWRLADRLRARFRSIEPSFIHSNGMKAHVLARLAAPRGTPRLLHLHDFFSHRPLARVVLPFLAAGRAHGIAVSHAVARDVRALVPSLPTSVVHNPVDTDHFAPGLVDGASLDRTAGLPPAEGVVRVGMVGTYANWKGHATFLEALALVPEVRGFIVGGPIYATYGSQWTLEGLKAVATQLGVAERVGFVPFQGDPVEAYRSLDIVVHASTRPEPFGLTIAEAMSVGKAVIAAADGGALELFTEDVDALGHRPGDAVDLARQIRALATDSNRRCRLGDQARVSALSRFSTARFMAAVESALRKIGMTNRHRHRRLPVSSR